MWSYNRLNFVLLSLFKGLLLTKPVRRFLSWSNSGRANYLCSLAGLLRLLELLLVAVTLILARVPATWRWLSSLADTAFLTVGAAVGLTAILLVLLTARLLGHLPAPLVETLVTLVSPVQSLLEVESTKN